MLRVLIGVTGSVATIKLPELIAKLQESILNVQIKIVATERALHFIKLPVGFEVELMLDEDEWLMWKAREDPVLHIELRKWADIFLVAPLDANTLAKAANGICDNLLTSVLRAWDLSKPIVVCPAMNTAMWEHPLTKLQVERLVSIGYHVESPIEKLLMCGDHGIGAMASIDVIVDLVINLLKNNTK